MCVFGVVDLEPALLIFGGLMIIVAVLLRGNESWSRRRTKRERIIDGFLLVLLITMIANFNMDWGLFGSYGEHPTYGFLAS